MSGRQPEAEAAMTQALDLLDPLGPSTALAYAYGQRSAQDIGPATSHRLLSGATAPSR